VVADDLAATPPSNTLTLPAPLGTTRFYRVRVGGPP